MARQVASEAIEWVVMTLVVVVWTSCCSSGRRGLQELMVGYM